MSEKPKRRYVPRGQGKFIRTPSRFQQYEKKYDIVEDMKQMKPNINLAQLVELNPNLGVELSKATKRERVLRNQPWLHSGEKEINKINQEKHIVAMKTPIILGDIEVKAIIDTGTAVSAMTSALLKETQFNITEKSNTRCIMAGGNRIASLGKSEIEIEIGEIITPIVVEVIDSKDWTLIIGNDFLSRWNSNINFETETLTLQDQEFTMEIPISYYREWKVTFEIKEENNSEEEYKETEQRAKTH